MRKEKLEGRKVRMSPIQRVRIFLFSFLISTFSFGCQNPFTPSQPQTILPGKGSFSLSVNVSGTARTILPDTPKGADFTSYTLDFKPSSGDTVNESRSPANLGDPVYLDAGTYTLTVTAFLNDGGTSKPVARGIISIEIEVGKNTPGEVELSAIINDGAGTFTYNVTFPAGLASAEVKITEMDDETVSKHTKSFLTGDNDTTTTSYTETKIPLPAGYYDVVFTFEKADGQTLIWRELLHIYANLESEFEETFTDADFYRTQYTVTFNFNDGEGGPGGGQSVVHGATTSPLSPEPTRAGHVFDGWYDNMGGGGDAYNFATPVIIDLTLYAKWIKVDIMLTDDTLEMVTGDGGFTLYAGFSPKGILPNREITWLSSKPAVADIVDQNDDELSATVMAMSAGTTIITVASVADPTIKADCTVTVTKKISTGESSDPFLIYDEDDLRKVGTDRDGWTLAAHYKVANDFDVDEPWTTPIGSYTSATDNDPFTGTFDGNSKTINGLSINATTDNQGLFGYIIGVVKNLILENVDITSTGTSVGGIAGRTGTGAQIVGCSVSGKVSGAGTASATSSGTGGVVGYNYGGTVENCYTEGTVSGTYSVGGVVGYVGTSAGKVQNCHATGEVSGTQLVGGVVGQTFTGGTVQNCYATGKVSGTQLVGGVVGQLTAGTVQNCYATGNVIGANSIIGGVVGNIAASSISTVQNCYATGNVSGVAGSIGGVVGQNSNTNVNARVQNCYATGNVSSTYGAIGGVVGHNSGTVQNCYATGTVSCTSTNNAITIGGVVGNNTGTVQNCYATGTVSCTSTNTNTNSAFGGVVGNNTGSVQNCVALNANIEATVSITNFGRVVGQSTGTNLVNNYGRSDMQKNGSSFVWANKAADDRDGADIVADDYQGQGWWSGTAQFNFGTDGAWEWSASNKLPILRGFAADTQNPTVSCIVTFNSNGGTAVASQTVAAGGMATNPGNPTNGSNVFVNWYIDSTLTVYNFSTPVTGNIALHARWVIDNDDFEATPINRIFNVATTGEWEAARTAIVGGGPDKNYVINVIGNFNVPGFTIIGYPPSPDSFTFGNATGIKVSLRGEGRTVSCSSGSGNMICIQTGQTVILRGLTLQGRSGTTGVLLYTYWDEDTDMTFSGTFIMHSGKISGNSGGGVGMGAGTFTMNGGEITGNSGNGVGMGGGTFTMNGGEISGNTANGVNITWGTFTMNSGTISGNGNSSKNGGGVYVDSGIFTMNGGIISGNTASVGGGVGFDDSTFTMNGGTITGNTAFQGGGVGGYFTTIIMNGGEISGNTADDNEYGGGGVFLDMGTIQITNGTIYGSNASIGLANIAPTGVALWISGTAQYGTFTGNSWSGTDLSLTNNPYLVGGKHTNNTIRVEEGVLK